MTALTGLLLAVLLPQADTVRVRLAAGPSPRIPSDARVLGPPSLHVGPAGSAVWLLRYSDTVYIHCWIPDPTPDWTDEMVVSLDVAGDGAARPQHDDFQWELHRALDSSVVSRGRNDRWEPPRGDPHWRLGPARAGGGWSVDAAERGSGWWVLLRLEGPWVVGDAGGRPRFAIRVRDSDSARWAVWPEGGVHPSAVEGSPALWGVVVEDP